MISRLPHRGPALLVRSIQEMEEDRITCTASVPAESPFNDGSRVPSFVALEIAAQAAALLEIGRLAPEGPARGEDRQAPLTGYLVRVRDVQMACDDFAIGEEITAEVQRLSAASHLAIYECSVSSVQGNILRGQFTTYVDRPPRRA